MSLLTLELVLKTRSEFPLLLSVSLLLAHGQSTNSNHASPNSISDISSLLSTHLAQSHSLSQHLTALCQQLSLTLSHSLPFHNRPTALQGAAVAGASGEDTGGSPQQVGSTASGHCPEFPCANESDATRKLWPTPLSHTNQRGAVPRTSTDPAWHGQPMPLEVGAIHPFCGSVPPIHLVVPSAVPVSLAAAAAATPVRTGTTEETCRSTWVGEGLGDEEEGRGMADGPVDGEASSRELSGGEASKCSLSSSFQRHTSAEEPASPHSSSSGCDEMFSHSPDAEGQEGQERGMVMPKDTHAPQGSSASGGCWGRKDNGKGGQTGETSRTGGVRDCVDEGSSVAGHQELELWNQASEQDWAGIGERVLERMTGMDRGKGAKIAAAQRVLRRSVVEARRRAKQTAENNGGECNFG